MTIKVFKANNQGKIELTQAELEKLLNEVYDSGYKEGKQSVSINIPSTSTPYWGWRDGISTTGTLGNGNIALLSDKTTADAITGTTATTKTNMNDVIKTTAKAVTDSGIMNSKELGAAVDSILRNFAAVRSCPTFGNVTTTAEAKTTPFTNLQKELAGL